MSNAQLIAVITPMVMQVLVLFVVSFVFTLFAVDIWAEYLREAKREELANRKHLLSHKAYDMLTAGPDTSKLVIPLAIACFLATVVAVIVIHAWKG